MKLVFAIVNNDDSHSVSSALTQGGFPGDKACVHRRIPYGGKHHVHDML